MGIHIRDATPADQQTIAEFNSRMAEETEGKRLDPALVGPGVAAVLHEPAKGRFWLAEIEGEIAGQIMVAYEWSDWRNGMLWWIESVYVPSQFRRLGVFSALYQHVESLCKADTEACGLRLCVEKDNLRAQQTYESLGMSKPGYIVMESFFSTGES